METKKNKNVQWLDIVNPSEADLATLKRKFGLHPLIAEELRAPSVRARVEATKDYLFFIYYFPLYDTKDESSIRSEIDIIVTKNTIATIHYESLENVLGGFDIGDAKTSLELLYRFVEHLIIFEERQLRHIREKVEAVGRDVFKGQEKEVLQRITALKRDISEYRISVRMQEPILKSLLIKGDVFWGNSAEIYLTELISEQMKVVSEIQDYREAITDFEETNNQLMNLKMNSVMQRLTTITFIVFPVTVIAELFMMNAPGTPIIGLSNAFWVIIGIMIVVSFSVYLYFKKRNLL